MKTYKVYLRNRTFKVHAETMRQAKREACWRYNSGRIYPEAIGTLIEEAEAEHVKS